MDDLTLEVNLLSAKDLNKVNLITKMDVYVVVSISRDGDKAKQKTKTPVDHDGDNYPSWNFPMKFTVDETAVKQDRLILVFQLRCERALGDKDIGEVHVPVKELLESSRAADGKTQFVSYQVRKPNGKPKGQLSFSYKVGAKFSGSAAIKSVHEPVTAYLAPAGTSSLYPQLDVYPPLSNVYPPLSNVYPPPSTVAKAPAGAAAWPYPPPKEEGTPSGYKPVPAGYPAPATAGYPPAPQPGYGYGYPPQPAYGYGYGYPPQAPPAGYGYPPQPGYGYYPPVQQPPRKNKFGMGLGAGLLGGALGGLLIGDMISDTGAYYDAGYSDVGGFDGGFGF